MLENDGKNSQEPKEMNGEKTVEETEDKRDEKGRFVPGGSGGPGRGKKANDDFQLAKGLLELVESVAREGITGSPDLKDKLNAAKLALNVEARKKPEEDADPCHPVVVGLLGLIENLAEVGENCFDVMKRMAEVCPGCDKLCSKRIDVDSGLDGHQ